MYKKLLAVLLASLLFSTVTGCAAKNASDLSTAENISSVQDESDLSIAENSLGNDVSEEPSVPVQSADNSAITSVQSSKDVPVSSSGQDQSETKSNIGSEIVDTNCRLIVKGKDITDGNYVNIIEGYQEINYPPKVEKYSYQEAEIPLIAVLKELGVKVEWQGQLVNITHNDGSVTVLDTEEPDFGVPLPPGTPQSVRKIIGNDVILDDTTAGYLIEGVGGKIRIDYVARIVSID